MAKIAQATAKVRLTLEINIDSVWGDKCELEQVYKQAKDSALLKINQKLGGDSETLLKARLRESINIWVIIAEGGILLISAL